MPKKVTNKMNDKLTIDGKLYTGEITKQFIEQLMDQNVFVSLETKGKTTYTRVFRKSKPFFAQLKKQGILENYQEAMKKVRQVKKTYKLPLTKAQETRLKTLQKKKVNDDKNRITSILKANNVSIKDIAKVKKLKDKYDPVMGPAFGSAWAFDGVRYTGSWLYLAPGWTYPNWKWLNFNDRASSAFGLPGHGAILWRHSWFRGATLVFHGPNANRPYFGWFSNRASSSSHW